MLPFSLTRAKSQKKSSNRSVLSRFEKSEGQAERGMALLIVLVCSTLFMLLGLSLALTSMTTFRMSNEFEAREKALLIADGGFNLTRTTFRGNALSALLSNATQVDQYLNFPVPTEPTALQYFNRNPLSPVEAMHVDYASLPTAIGTRTVNGLLTVPTGVSLGTGHYFARVTDNDDGDGDLLSDTDSVVTLRVMGIRRSSTAETSVYGTKTQNAIAILEATLRRDTTLNLDSAFSVYGPALNATFNGNTFGLDGRPHDMNGNLIAGTSKPGLSLANNNPGNANATGAANSAYSSLAGMQMDNLVGADGDFGPLPSIKDDTDTILNSSDPDAANIFDPNWLMAFVDKLTTIADNSLPAGAYDTVTWGTTGSPEITVIDGDASLETDGSGAGILVIKGDLAYNGAFTYTGMIFVLGGNITMSGANKTIIGGTFTANVIANGNGTYHYGPNSIAFNGNSDFLYSPQAISLATNLLPMRVLNWRVSTREMEPY